MQTLKEGTVLNNRYTVRSVLGRGGYGITYRVYDEIAHIERAVKEFFPKTIVTRQEGSNQVQLLKSEYGSRYNNYIKQFLFEARFLAKFDVHPHIVAIQEFFEENQTAYFVMEYLEGMDLREYLMICRDNGQCVSVSQTIKSIKQVLEALTVLHKEHVVHCDIKPSNIFVESDGNIKLIDFGLAQNIEADYANLGMTRAYAAPEQFINERLGNYTDIYSIGVVMYEMLTLKKVTRADKRLVKDNVSDVIKYNPNVSVQLNNIIMRAMAVMVNNRFSGTKQLIDALDGKARVRTIDELNRMHYIGKIMIYAIFIISILLFLLSVCLNVW